MGGRKMKYIVSKNKTEFEYLGEGTHFVKIEKVDIKETEERFIDKELSDLGLRPQQISLLLKDDKGAVVWDTIYQRFDKETFSLSFSQWKLDSYSHALEIPEGTVFNTTQEWLNFIVGKDVAVVIENNEKGFGRVKSVHSTKDKMPF